MTRLAALAMLALSGGLSGCPSVPEGAGPCPCVAALRCCAPTNQCLPPTALCAESGVTDPIVTITPAVGVAGDLVQIEVTPAAEIVAVRIGPSACDPVDDDASRCRVPGYRDAQAAVDVQVELRTADGPAIAVRPAGFRYRLPAFIEVSLSAGVASSMGRGVVSHDLDGDGGRDLIFAVSDADSPAVFRQAGPWRYVADTGLAPLRGLRVEDLDQDGTLDLLALHGAGDLLDGAPWSRRIDGETRPAGAGPDAGDFTRSETLDGVLVDLNGDGWADWVGHRQTVALNRPGWARTLLVAQGGPTGFEARPTPFEPDALFTTGEVRRYALIDYDDDGDADVLVCGDALWLFANENGVLFDRSDRLGPPIERPCGDLAVADFDRDGAFDIAWVPAQDYAQDFLDAARSGVWVLRNTGGAFTANSPQPAPNDPDCGINRAPGSTLALGRSVIAAFDVDLDGDEDLFLPTPYSLCPGPMAWYENASGRFVAQTLIGPFPGIQPSAALPIDLDLDGDLDVVTSAFAPGERGRVWRNLAVEDDAKARALVVVLDAPQTARGARVTLTADGATQQRMIGSLGNADGPPEAHFGLGSSAPPYVISVRWSDGTERVVEHDAAGRVLVGR